MILLLTLVLLAYLGLTQWFVASLQQQSIDDSVKCRKSFKMLWYAALPVRCWCRRKEIKMYVIAVAWFFQINFSKTKLRSVMSQDRLEALFAISFHRKRCFITVKRCWFSCMLCSKSGPSHVISLGLNVKFYKLAYIRLYFH